MAVGAAALSDGLEFATEIIARFVLSTLRGA